MSARSARLQCNCNPRCKGVLNPYAPFRGLGVTPAPGQRGAAALQRILQYHNTETTSQQPWGEMNVEPTIETDADGTIRCYLAEPPSANRWWRNVGGRMVLSAAAREYKAMVGRVALVARVRAIAKPCTVGVRLIWWRGRKSGDLDKRLGVLLDALQGVAYENDSQIVRIEADRRDAPNAHSVVVHIQPLTTIGARGK